MSSAISWTENSREEAGSLPSESILATWWCLPAVVCLSLNLFLSSTRGSLDGHEVLVAQTAREMVRSHDWIHPTFAGSARYQKPPLAYWLAGSTYQCTGVISAFTARLPSVMAALLLTLLSASVVNRAYGPQIARWTGFMQATTFWSLNYGSSAIVDMTLSLMVAVGIFASADDIPTRLPRPFLIMLFWMMAGLSVLAKGPLGVALILSIAILFRITRAPQHANGNSRFFITWWTIPGIACFVLLACGWGAMVLWTEPNVIDIWRDQSLGRFLVHWGPQTRPWYYYLYQVPLLTFPWAPLWMIELYAIFRERKRGRSIDPLRWLCVIWFGVTILLLTLSEGKREHYILPGLVPLSILAALAGDRLVRVASTVPRKVIEGTFAFVVVTAVGIGVFEWARFDEMELLAEEVATHRASIDAASIVVQYGSNEHASCFVLDRPMRWCGGWDEAEAILHAAPDSLLLVPATRLAEVQQRRIWQPLSEHLSSKSKPALVLLSHPSN